MVERGIAGRNLNIQDPDGAVLKDGNMEGFFVNGNLGATGSKTEQKNKKQREF